MLYHLHVLVSHQLMHVFALCDVATSRSRPPCCKLKQMSDEGKGLVLHNGGALPWECYDVAPELTTLSLTIKKVITWKLEGLRKFIKFSSVAKVPRIWTTWARSLTVGETSGKRLGPCTKGGTFHTGVSDPGSHRETFRWPQGGKTHRQRKKKKAQEPQTQATPQTWGRLCVYDPTLPPRRCLHTHTEHAEKCTAPWTTHCWADLFKSQELCLSFATSCSQKYLWACNAVWFFSCFLHAYVCIDTHTHTHT